MLDLLQADHGDQLQNRCIGMPEPRGVHQQIGERVRALLVGAHQPDVLVERVAEFSVDDRHRTGRYVLRARTLQESGQLTPRVGRPSRRGVEWPPEPRLPTSNRSSIAPLSLPRGGPHRIDPEPPADRSTACAPEHKSSRASTSDEAESIASALRPAFVSTQPTLLLTIRENGSSSCASFTCWSASSRRRRDIRRLAYQRCAYG